jgi:hypothetical protein
MTDVTEGGTAPAAWYGDHTARHEYRYWDGSHWTNQVSDRGVVTTDRAGRQGGPPTPVSAGDAVGADVYSIGDIRITADTIVTPSGSAPLKESQWSTRVGTRTKEPRPAVHGPRLVVEAAAAIILAILLVLASLLLLLFAPLLPGGKQRPKVITVTVRSGSLMYMTGISAGSQKQVLQIRRQVAYARSLAAAAG